ncbi:transcriptional regulator [Mangrovactinospora gilvigrisea]|uniref:Transcriptional regulator n=1 Tax=Mangrovactinospora gilvigrisea TaxID=1428644 RepID=A0A1J7BBT0_9ACTN|nr:helix-turn-helix transcriptional regulator [Mangrovactinospora gilvigrisea]OIV36143.1 transcriptional regulator [Mangrovactinospora gilvigrisea]
MTTIQQGSGSVVRRILLGSQLRKLRESRGISREDAGYSIRASESKISRMELGRVSFKERDVADLLTLYGIDDEGERKALLRLARDANAAGWWHDYGDVLFNWFQTYVGLEEAASLIRTYEMQFVPGLLQTEEYAHAVNIQYRPNASKEEVERRVGMRMRRQKLLVDENAPRLWAVLDEAALRRPIGGRDVMRGQVEKLIEATENPNVVLQIMPFRFGGHAAQGGAFTLLRFPEADLPDVVYLEQLTGALYLDKRDDVDEYANAMERLCVDSMSPERSLKLLRSIRDEL